MCLTIWLARRSAAKFKNVFISLKQEQSFPNDPIYNDSQNCKVPKNTCNKRGASPIHWNHKTLLREIYKGIRHWVLGLEDSVLLKCQFSPNWYINSVQYQSKPKQTSFFNRSDMLILKSIQKFKRSVTTKAMLKSRIKLA